MEIHRYEKAWMGISIAAVVVMLVALALAGFGMGTQLPGAVGSVDPRTLAQKPPFDKPGVFEVSAGRYQVIMVAQTWAFNPAEIRVPAGSQVSFKVTSRDVTHGILIEKTNANVMIIPGQIAEFDVTFDTPGEYRFVCHEYCGAAHQAMTGKIIVEP